MTRYRAVECDLWIVDVYWPQWDGARGEDPVQVSGVVLCFAQSQRKVVLVVCKEMQSALWIRLHRATTTFSKLTMAILS